MRCRRLHVVASGEGGDDVPGDRAGGDDLLDFRRGRAAEVLESAAVVGDEELVVGGAVDVRPIEFHRRLHVRGAIGGRLERRRRVLALRADGDGKRRPLRDRRCTVAGKDRLNEPRHVARRQLHAERRRGRLADLFR